MTDTPIGRPAYELRAGEPHAAATLRNHALALRAAGLLEQAENCERLAADFDRWEAQEVRLHRVLPCECGGWKSIGAELCMACRQKVGWHRPKPGDGLKIAESVMERARELYERGDGFLVIARALRSQTNSVSDRGLAESLRHQFKVRGWPTRGRGEATSLSNRARAATPRPALNRGPAAGSARVESALIEQIAITPAPPAPKRKPPAAPQPNTHSVAAARQHAKRYPFTTVVQYQPEGLASAKNYDFMALLADGECEHGRLPTDKAERINPCGCWPQNVKETHAPEPRRIPVGSV